MQDITLTKGKSYNQTVLDLMMRCPTIFPSENAACRHLFLDYGTGFSWNISGQIAYYLKDTERKKKRFDRTKESIIGEHKEGDQYCNHCKFERNEECCFYSCGERIVFWTSDLSENYSPIMFVLRGEVKPNKNWENALISFCYDIIRPNLKYYRNLLKGYCQYHYPAMWESWYKRYVNDYKKLRKIAEQLINKIQKQSK